MLLLNLELNATAKHPQQQQQPDSLDPRQTRMRCSLSPPPYLSRSAYKQTVRQSD